MKIKEIQIRNFKRFSNLIIKNLPETAKLVVLVGPNGCGKTSLFEALNYWYKLNGYNSVGNADFYIKKNENEIIKTGDWYSNRVVITKYGNDITNQLDVHGKFYFRSAYRNEPQFVTKTLSKQDDPTIRIDHETLMTTDATVSSNYQRLISSTLSGVYNNTDENKTINQLRDELIGRLQEALKKVFEDLQLSSIGDPLINGSFYFTKGISTNFPYANLSAGEKSAFDLLLDLIIKSIYYTDTVFCIDEPESHMHTSLQSKLLEELYSLIPDNSQLWISTHSMGMLKKAKELEEKNPGTVVFLDFDNRDFDSEVVMTPSKIDSTMWKRFLDLAFGDLSTLIAPSTIVFCEGNPQGRKFKDFDAQIYHKIFEKEFPDVCFTSIGSCSEIENEENTSMKIISKVLSNSQKIKLVDRDARTPEEVEELKQKGIKVLSKRHIESFLLDDEVLQLLCKNEGKSDKYQEIVEMKKLKLESSITRGNAADDIKSASGEIFVEIKRILQLNRGGNTKDAFFRDIMAPLITPETRVYQELKNEIFG
ncbi:MAG: AAA family ATPase [Treponema sp.]|uniref:AAA family ATPase n=1 Tax=Treponema sp. TaxID=166 RepID=UPI002A90BC0E|nr:AAA family ATPase [Treponema sp.]MDY6398435.1 AAA family ATPase [Treponema sp.]